MQSSLKSTKMDLGFLHCLCLLALCLLPYVSVAQTNYQNISLGWSLVASDNSRPWLSPSRDFAIGFHRLDNQNLYLLSIWFDKIPNKTLVWYANGDNPAPLGSRVQLTRDGQLSLTNPDGAEIWTPKSGTSGLVTYAALLDTGNLILATVTRCQSGRVLRNRLTLSCQHRF